MLNVVTILAYFSPKFNRQDRGQCLTIHNACIVMYTTMQIQFGRKRSSWHNDIKKAEEKLAALDSVVNKTNRQELHTNIDHGHLGKLAIVDSEYLKRRADPTTPLKGHTVKVLPIPDIPQAEPNSEASS